MKRHIIGLLLAVIALTACDIEHSANGLLDGYWQLTQMDTLASGQSADMTESTIYWAVQHHLLEMKKLNEIERNVFFRFEHSDATLRIYNPISDNKAISDSVVTSPLTLQPFGIQHLDETLAVEQLTSGRMVLRNELFRFHFRKY